MTAELNYIDSGWLISTSHYQQLLRQKSATAYIATLANSVEDYAHCLADYPNIKYEQLEKFYKIHQHLSVFNYKLAEDFFHLGYKGACWASLLISLSPDEKYTTLLQDFLDSCHPENRWIADIAISTIKHKKHEVSDNLLSISQNLERLPKENIVLRTFPSSEDRLGHDTEILTIREIYKSQGLDKALAYAMTTKVYFCYLDYPAWKKHCNPTP